jgi:hypothetical protein
LICTTSPFHRDNNIRMLNVELCSRVDEGSILAVQVFDQKKFKKKDQGFLGVINIRIGDLIPEIGPEADGMSQPPCPLYFLARLLVAR